MLLYPNISVETQSSAATIIKPSCSPLLNTYTPALSGYVSRKDKPEKDKPYTPPYKQEYSRYIPVGVNTALALRDTFTNPDYSNLNRASAVAEAIPRVGTSFVGSPMARTVFDRYDDINNIDAQNTKLINSALDLGNTNRANAGATMLAADMNSAA